MTFKNIGFLCLFLSVIYSCKHDVEPVYPTVVVDNIVQEDVKLYGEYVGHIRAHKYVEVRARVEGYLKKMMFDEGKSVEEGDALFQIDPVQYVARYEKARAQLKHDSASLRKSVIDGQHKLHPGVKVRPVEATEELTSVSSTKETKE